MTDVLKDSSSHSYFFELVDSSTGLPKTGILYTDVTGSFVRTREERTAITPATLASASAGWDSGGFILIDDTNQPGVCRFDVPNAAFVTGAEEVVVTVKSTGCRAQSRLFRLVNVDDQDAVRMGLTNLDATVSSRLATTSYTAPDNTNIGVAATQATNANTALGAAGAGLTSIPKTGYKLASDGLDSIDVTAPSTVATTFPGMVMQVWRRFFKKATKSSSQIITYADDDTTPVTTQTISESGSDESQGAAS